MKLQIWSYRWFLNPTAPIMGGRADLLLEMKQILRFLQERGRRERARVQRMVVIFLTSLCILDSWLGELSSNLEDIFLIWQNTNQEDHLLDLTLTLFLKRGQICCILLCIYCLILSKKSFILCKTIVCKVWNVKWREKQAVLMGLMPFGSMNALL